MRTKLYIKFMEIYRDIFLVVAIVVVPSAVQILKILF